MGQRQRVSSGLRTRRTRRRKEKKRKYASWSEPRPTFLGRHCTLTLTLLVFSILRFPAQQTHNATDGKFWHENGRQICKRISSRYVMDSCLYYTDSICYQIKLFCGRGRRFSSLFCFSSATEQTKVVSGELGRWRSVSLDHSPPSWLQAKSLGEK